MIYLLLTLEARYRFQTSGFGSNLKHTDENNLSRMIMNVKGYNR
jgi:hypothetical protein